LGGGVPHAAIRANAHAMAAADVVKTANALGESDGAELGGSHRERDTAKVKHSAPASALRWMYATVIHQVRATEGERRRAPVGGEAV
jgi:hypothetical protein